ncbi:MAG: hypothetical protein ABIM46_01610 [candidate division WOR-3 bacterium]
MLGLFLSIVAQVPTVSLPVEFVTSETPASLFFLNPGFLDPSRSEGIVGADMNPSVLGFSKNNIDLYVAGSMTSSSGASLSFDLPVEAGDTVLASVPVDLDGTFTDQGGFDYFGIGGRLGLASLGFIYQRPSYVSVGLPDGFSFGTTIEAESLTSFDYEYVAGSDTIPLRLKLGGSATATLYPALDAEMRQAPIFFGGALKLGPFAFGFGYKMRKYTAELHAKGRVSLDSARLACAPRAEGWNTDSLSVYLDVPETDSLFYAEYDGVVQGSQNAILFGISLRPLKFLGISLGIEGGMRSSVTTVYTRTIYLPDTVAGSLSPTEDNVVVDPVDSTISGSLVLGGGSILYSVDTLRDEIEYNLLQYIAVRGGINLFVVNLGGGLELAENADGVYMGTNYLTPSVGIPLPKSELRIGSVIAWRYAKAGDYYIPSVPLIYGGAGLTIKPDLNMGGIVLQEIGIGAKASALAYTLDILSSTVTDRDVDVGSLMPNFSVSAGLRLGFRLPEEE